MIAEFYGVLVDLTIATTAAALIALLLRRPLRAAFGARAAYALWVLLPIAWCVLLLPSPSPQTTLPVVMALPLAWNAAPGAIGADGSALAAGVLSVWLLGAVLTLLANIRRQRKFRRSLGALRLRTDGCLQSESVDLGPAVVGLWTGNIVLPADFDSRYSAEERELILRHERVHLDRRDLLANLIAVAIRCANWFNPIVHRAVTCFRFDQELAADAVVLAQRPSSRRSYADAMLKAQWSDFGSPLGCRWQPLHPLKERILMLKRPLPGVSRSVIGFLIAGVVSLSFGYAAWASQPQAGAIAATPASYNSLTPPKYPQSAVDARMQGTVLLKIRIDAAGKAQDIEVQTSSGYAALDAAGKDAAANWTFNPAQQDGQPVEHWVQVPITFALDEHDAERPAAANPEGALEEIYVRKQ